VHPYETIVLKRAITAWAQDAAAKNDMKFLMVANVTNSESCLFCTAFIDHHRKTLPEVKEFAKDYLNRYLDFLKNCPDLHAFFTKVHSVDPKDFPWTELALEQVGFKISYWDNDMNRFAPPYVSEVVFADKTFSYYEADAQTGKLRLVCTEQYKNQ
jgi:hypothetical protein